MKNQLHLLYFALFCISGIVLKMHWDIVQKDRLPIPTHQTPGRHEPWTADIAPEAGGNMTITTLETLYIMPEVTKTGIGSVRIMRVDTLINHNKTIKP